jgi:hypothetical protein
VSPRAWALWRSPNRALGGPAEGPPPDTSGGPPGRSTGVLLGRLAGLGPLALLVHDADHGRVVRGRPLGLEAVRQDEPGQEDQDHDGHDPGPELLGALRPLGSLALVGVHRGERSAGPRARLNPPDAGSNPARPIRFAKPFSTSTGSPKMESSKLGIPCSRAAGGRGRLRSVHPVTIFQQSRRLCGTRRADRGRDLRGEAGDRLLDERPRQASLVQLTEEAVDANLAVPFPQMQQRPGSRSRAGGRLPSRPKEKRRHEPGGGPTGDHSACPATQETPGRHPRRRVV